MTVRTTAAAEATAAAESAATTGATVVAAKARQQRNLRSGAVVLGSVGLLAATLVACSSDADKRCVDPNTYKKVDDKNCHDGGTGRYYYGGKIRDGKATGGSFDKSAVKRGGLGGHGSGSHGG